MLLNAFYLMCDIEERDRIAKNRITKKINDSFVHVYPVVQIVRLNHMIELDEDFHLDVTDISKKLLSLLMELS